jgi:hypothetical protein
MENTHASSLGSAPAPPTVHGAGPNFNSSAFGPPPLGSLGSGAVLSASFPGAPPLVVLGGGASLSAFGGSPPVVLGGGAALSTSSSGAPPLGSLGGGAPPSFPSVAPPATSCCPPCTLSSQHGSSERVTCTGGSYSESFYETQFDLCSAGTAQCAISRALSSKCSSGTFSKNISTTCTCCPPETSFEQGSTDCQPCPAASYSEGGECFKCSEITNNLFSIFLSDCAGICVDAGAERTAFTVCIFILIIYLRALLLVTSRFATDRIMRFQLTADSAGRVAKESAPNHLRSSFVRNVSSFRNKCRSGFDYFIMAVRSSSAADTAFPSRVRSLPMSSASLNAGDKRWFLRAAIAIVTSSALGYVEAQGAWTTAQLSRARDVAATSVGNVAFFAGGNVG